MAVRVENDLDEVRRLLAEGHDVVSVITPLEPERGMLRRGDVHGITKRQAAGGLVTLGLALIAYFRGKARDDADGALLEALRPHAELAKEMGANLTYRREGEKLVYELMFPK